MDCAERGFGIGEASDRSGLSRRALRHYEQCGLLMPERASNNYRIYSEQQLKYATAIRDLRSAGVPLAIIGKVISIKSSGLPLRRKVDEFMVVLQGIEQNLRAKRKELNAALRHVEGFRRECSRVLRAGRRQARGGGKDARSDR